MGLEGIIDWAGSVCKHKAAIFNIQPQVCCFSLLCKGERYSHIVQGERRIWLQGMATMIGILWPAWLDGRSFLSLLISEMCGKNLW